MQTYTVTRRHDNAFVQSGLRYFDALALCDQHPGVDHVIHPDDTDWMEKKRKTPYDADQGGWAWL